MGEADEPRRPDRGPVLLVALLSSLFTAVIMLLIGPQLAYPQLAALIRGDVQRIEKQVKELRAQQSNGVRTLDQTAPAVGASLLLAGKGDGSGKDALPPVTLMTVAAERVAPAVVGVINRGELPAVAGPGRNPGRNPHEGQIPDESGGSGVIIDPRGYIVTNQHVVEGSLSLGVILSDGRRLDARLIGADKRNDLAVIKVDAENLPVAVFGDSDRVRIGDWAIAIGNPVSLEFQRTVTAGIISGLNRGLEVGNASILEVLQTDAAISPGNSGGPLVNALGQVVGINTAKITLPDVEGMGFAVPANRVRLIVDQLIQYGKVSHAWLGIGIKQKNDPSLTVKLERGILVAQVLPGGPAQQAGFRAGDIILAVDGVPINDYLSLRRLLESKKVGEQVRVTIQRGQEERTLPVTLGRMPEE